MALRAVFFDLDGTLIDERGLTDGIEEVAHWLAPRTRYGAEEIVTASNRVWQQIWPTMYEDWIHGRLGSDELARRAWASTLSVLAIDSPELLEGGLAAYREAQLRGHRPFGDAAEAIASARAAGLRIGIVSNGAADLQREKLAVLDAAFDPVVISGECDAVAKPDPRIFEIALERIGVAPAEAAHVGDSVGVDVEGALAAGLNAVWINRTGADRAQPGIEIRSLRGLGGALGY